MNKKKIFNDPVYGFIPVQNELIFDLIQHPYFQRLRRIKQLGLTEFVYPGALHTRFHHALGAMHLMGKTLDSLRAKGHMIFDAEYEASLVAILLHDIGHGPFSHTLEFSLFNGIDHEEMASWALKKLNKDFEGRLNLAMQIFEKRYPREFFGELVSSQLDIDRLDYLQRDCYFTGVQEGTIGAERIIQMLNIVNDRLVVEEKGLYSIESFLSARRIMYWQVYLHKTAVCAEKMLILLIQRARELTQNGISVPSTPAFTMFLERNISSKDFEEDPDILDVFMVMDDSDVWGSIKFWVNHDDKILSQLSKRLLTRNLFRVKLMNEKPSDKELEKLTSLTAKHFDISLEETSYYVSSGKVSNSAYLPQEGSIVIQKKSGELVDVAKAVDLPNIKAISKIVEKYYLCWPKDVPLKN